MWSEVTQARGSFWPGRPLEDRPRLTQDTGGGGRGGQKNHLLPGGQSDVSIAATCPAKARMRVWWGGPGGRICTYLAPRSSATWKILKVTPADLSEPPTGSSVIS